MRVSGFLLGLLLAAAGLTAGCSADIWHRLSSRRGSGSSRDGEPGSAALEEEEGRPKVGLQSVDLRGLEEVQPYRGNTKTNGESGRKCRLYQWDYTHGDTEVYDCAGKHLGSMDPANGKMTKLAEPGRTLGGAS